MVYKLWDNKNTYQGRSPFHISDCVCRSLLALLQTSEQDCFMANSNGQNLYFSVFIYLSLTLIKQKSDIPIGGEHLSGQVAIFN